MTALPNNLIAEGNGTSKMPCLNKAASLKTSGSENYGCSLLKALRDFASLRS